MSANEWRVKLYRGKYAAVRSVAGKTERYSLRTSDLQEARQRLTELTAKPTLTLVGDMAAHYLADKDKTAIRSEDLHGSWKQAEPFFSHLTAPQITRDICRAYRDHRYAKGRKPNTVRKELEMVRAAVRFCGGQGAVFELPPPPPRKERYLDKDEARRLVRAAKSYRHIRAFIVLGLCTGARTSALLDLTWDRVDFKRGLIRLPLGTAMDEQMKTRATVPMNRRARRYLKILHALATCDYVIEWGGSQVGSIKKGFAAACQRAGIEGVTPHILRHTAASWMAERDVPIFEIARFLGHSDSRITERTYAKLRPSYLKGAAAALTW